MASEFLTLAELSERSGIEVRTLRSWIAQRVVPGPETIGRNARYSPAALNRARAAKALRDLYNMSLTAIRQELIAADAARIEAYAAMAPGQGMPDSPAEVVPPSGTSAADYLRKLRRSGTFGTQGLATATRSVPPGRMRQWLYGPRLQAVRSRLGARASAGSSESWSGSPAPVRHVARPKARRDCISPLRPISRWCFAEIIRQKRSPALSRLQTFYGAFSPEEQSMIEKSQADGRRRSFARLGGR